MEATVTINSRGVITLPTKLRKQLGLKADLERGHELVADGFVLAEARRNQERKARDQALADLAKLLAVLEVAPFRVLTSDVDWLAWLPEKDQPVLAAASALSCTHLVTGDRTHFGVAYGREFRGVTILSPAMAFAVLG
jgi:uncharacterized protein